MRYYILPALVAAMGTLVFYLRGYVEGKNETSDELHSKEAAEAARVEAERVAKEVADKAAADRAEVEKVAQAICDALPAIAAPAVEIKPEPVNQVNVMSKAHFYAPLKSVSLASQTTTRAEINAILDTLAEADLDRTLHYLQSRFVKVAA